MADKPTPKKAVKKSKPKTAPTHPPVMDMIKAAIINLKEKNGSSRQAIMKYIQAHYKVDADKLAPFIKKQLVTGAAKGILLHTKGIGASGSFKLSTSQKAAKASKPKRSKSPKKKKPAKKAASTGAAKKPKAKKSPKPKKAKSPKKPKKPKTPKKKPASKAKKGKK